MIIEENIEQFQLDELELEEFESSKRRRNIR